MDLTNTGEVYDVFTQFWPEGVCHLAANPSPFGLPRHQTFENNVINTSNVMQAAGDVGVSRLVYASSEMATGWLTTDELPPRFPFDENDRVDSPNAYALSTYLGEVIADSMVRQYPSMSICSLRIDNMIMPDGYDVRQFRRDTSPEGGVVDFWSYIDARDVATAFLAGLEGEIAGHEVFLIADADTCLDTSIEEAVARLQGSGAGSAPDHGPFDSVFKCRTIAGRLGWRPQHSWRDG